MKVVLSTSTKIGTFDPTVTTITFRFDEDRIQESKIEANELPALLEWTAETVTQLGKGTRLEIHSMRNTFSNAFEMGWIERWKAGGFRKQPTAHRELWKALDTILDERQVVLSFVHPNASEIQSTLSRRFPDPPGTPLENPWAPGENSDEMLQRALKKS